MWGRMQPTGMAHIVRKPASALMALWSFGRGLLRVLTRPWRRDSFTAHLLLTLEAQARRQGVMIWGTGRRDLPITVPAPCGLLVRDNSITDNSEAEIVLYGIRSGIFLPDVTDEAQVTK